MAGIFRNKDEFVVCTGIGWGLDRERERERGAKFGDFVGIIIFSVFDGESTELVFSFQDNFSSFGWRITGIRVTMGFKLL